MLDSVLGSEDEVSEFSQCFGSFYAADVTCNACGHTGPYGVAHICRYWGIGLAQTVKELEARIAKLEASHRSSKGDP